MFALTTADKAGYDTIRHAILVGNDSAKVIFNYIPCPVSSDAIDLLKDAVANGEYEKPAKMTEDEWWTILCHRIKIDFMTLTAH